MMPSWTLFLVTGAIAWQDWSLAVFERAHAEHRLVILDLGASWCHWCRVMEDVTYRDPKVAALIDERFIAVRAEQDTHPDLAERYEDWAWPATIIFAADGTELVKMRGFKEPEAMARVLEAVIADPTPGPSAAPGPSFVAPSSTLLSSEQRRALELRFREAYEPEHGGFSRVHKFIHADSMELALYGASRGDTASSEMAKRTLDANLQLIDPVWGGVYQYSDRSDPDHPWSQPHYEKLMALQADDMRLYANAYAFTRDRRYLDAAEDIHRYLRGFLRADSGAFYASQDADVSSAIPGKDFYARPDVERRRIGMPRVARSIYARENGWAIRGLCALYAVTHDPRTLEDAERAASEMIAHHGRADGGFRHGASDDVLLTDSLSMAQGLWALYNVSAKIEYLDRAVSAARFIVKKLRHPTAGFIAAEVDPHAIGVFKDAVREFDDNIAFARLASLLHHATGDRELFDAAQHALRYVASPSVFEHRKLVAGVLLADRELSSEPLHVTVVGSKKDPAARALFLAALADPALYRRFDWLDPQEPRREHDPAYPRTSRPTLYACAEDRCSPPVFAPQDVSRAIARIAR
jgi:uncharacterized protein YyaL (SSP411 family)